MKDENRFAPMMITNNSPLTTTELSIARNRSRMVMRRPSMPSRMAPKAPIEAASVGLKIPA